MEENNLYKVRDHIVDDILRMEVDDQERQKLINQLLMIDRQIADHEKQEAAKREKESEIEKIKIEARSRKVEAWIKVIGTVVGSVIMIAGGTFMNNYTLDHAKVVEDGGCYLTQRINSALAWFKPKS